MSPRYSTVRSTEIEYAFWLVFDADGGLRFSRGEPSIGRGERAMSCSATLPRSLFRTPELRATIGISETVPSEFKIDVDAVGAALRQAIGCDIDLRIQTPEAE